MIGVAFGPPIPSPARRAFLSKLGAIGLLVSLPKLPKRYGVLRAKSVEWLSIKDGSGRLYHIPVF